MDKYVLKEFIETIPVEEGSISDTYHYYKSEKYNKLAKEITETNRKASKLYKDSKKQNDVKLRTAANKEYKKLISLLKERNRLATKEIGADSKFETIFIPIAKGMVTATATASVGKLAGLPSASSAALGSVAGYGKYSSAKKNQSVTHTRDSLLKSYSYDLEIAEEMEKATRPISMSEYHKTKRELNKPFDFGD